MEAVSASRLRIGAFDARYLVAERHPSPERLARRLDEVVTVQLPDALRTALASALPVNDPGVWLIRDIEVAVDVNAAWEPEEIARAWAQQIGKALARDLLGSGDGTNVVRFRDRAALLARFSVDIAAGDAWSRWIYRSFAGLRHLPVSAAIRTALSERPALGLSALQRLDGRELATVTGALTAADAERVLEAMVARQDRASLDAILTTVLSAWTSLAGQCDALGGIRTALALFVRAASAGAGGRAARIAAEAIVALAAFARTHPQGSWSKMRPVLAGGDQGALLDIAHRFAPALAPLMSCADDRLDAAFTSLGPERAVSHGSSTLHHTRFGGALLLLPLLDALPLAAVAAQWPPLGEVSAAQMLRWLLLVKCQGEAQADAAFHDPLLRDLFHLPPSLGWFDAAQWMTELGASRRRALERALAHGPQGQLAAAEPVRVAHHQAYMQIRVDADGLWRSLRPCRRQRPSSQTPRATPAPPASAADDLQQLGCPRATGVAPAWDRVLTVGAQQALRRFALRLPGFARSGCRHLHRNFLDFAAALAFEETRIVARMGRPPLHLILGLTGATRATFQLDWIDPRPLALFSEA